MPIIKDSNYWKEYNQKRKEKGYFQQNYLQRKGVVKNVEPEKVVKSPEVVKNNSVVKVVKSLQPNPVVKNDSLQPTEILQPKEEVVKKQAKILQPQSELNILQPTPQNNSLEQNSSELDTDLPNNKNKPKAKQSIIDTYKETINDLTNQNKSLIGKVASLEKQLKNQTNFKEAQNLTPEQTLQLLTQRWRNGTAWNCMDSCSRNKYCSNCWYTNENGKMVDYKNEVRKEIISPCQKY